MVAIATPATEHVLEREILLSRQPVLDSNLHVAGYRITYAMLDGNATASAAGADALGLFDTALSVVGLEGLVGESIAYLPVSREMLLALGVPPVRPDRVLLRVGYDDALDPVLVPILETAAARGYTLELDRLPGADFDLDLLELFGIVELDLPAWSSDQLAMVLPQILARHRVALAANVRDHTQREFAESIGFERFVGPFFGTPKIVAGRNIPTGDIRALASAISLQGDGVTLEDVVEVIDRDVGLSIRLLRYINSAYFGLAGKIDSIRQAAVTLGCRGIARWALTATITGAPHLSPELAVMALTRARLCEMIGASVAGMDGNQLFTIGLLSAADAVLDLPLEDVLAELPLTDEVTQALLEQTGPAGQILAATLAYEYGDFDAVALGPFRRRNGHAYRTALSWARETLAHAA